VRKLSAAWAVTGVVAMLAYAVYRLAFFAVEAWDMGFTLIQAIILIIHCVFMAYSEGYKGFHLSFSPRFAARVRYILHEGRGIELILAPIFCFGYFGTSRAKQIVALTLTLLLVGIVSLMHYIPQPWRGIIDAGVVLGLSIGIISLLYWVFRQLQAEEYLHDPALVNNQNNT